MIDRLKLLIEQHGAKHWSFAARKDAEFMAWVRKVTYDMPDDTPFATRIYAAASGTRPICDQGGLRTLKSVIEGWQFCGKTSTCACAKAAVSAKVKASKAALTDADHEAINTKRAETFQQRYGVNNAGRLPQAVAAHQATYADPTRVAEATERGRKTMVERYGVDNALKLPKVNAVRPLIAASLSPETKAASAAKRSRHAQQGGLLDASYLKISRRCAEAGFTMLSTRTDYIGVGGTDRRVKYHFECHRCTLRFYDYIYDGAAPACPACDAVPASYVSRAETEVADYVEGLGHTVLRTSRKTVPGMELDIVVPALKVAVEYCGLYWHSEFSNGKGRDSHLEKLRACEERGYRLVTIFSDEWLDQKAICKARLAHILGHDGKRTYARHTRVVDVSAATARSFLERTHIQGYAPGASVHLGLQHGDDLVAVMTFGHLRASHNHAAVEGAWELYRFAAVGSVVGGASKLFRAFVRQHHPKTVLSFCDRRWGTGAVYEKMGFVLDGESRPGYAWVEKHMVRHYRYKFAKHELVKQGHDPALSETEIMRGLGYDRIWDCGNLRFQWTPK